MNGMPFDMVLSQPLAETFGAQGFAPNIASAHDMAWSALTTALGNDTADLPAWSLKVMRHGYSPEGQGGVNFSAEFARNPEFEPGAVES